MPEIGQSLLHYSITEKIGKGGMGEVFRAKDQKLGRDVAIKVLPEEFARDGDRIARFQREAKLLASLNHPNIAAIYGLEESSGTNFLVLELVEGEALADQIKRGPIPVDESLKQALQIAEALEAAHEKGVIHRDLKPANIKVAPDGKVKVLDFGLAKAFAGEQAEMVLSNSPTLSAAATQQGVILGTAAYMSPDQARGKPVDKRADIWAFGVVLFEMLTGKSLFEGQDVTSTLARVLERNPDFSTLPKNLHPRIRLLLERCLKKESRDRYSGIGDARVDIQEAFADPGGVFAQPMIAARSGKKLRTVRPWLVAALLGIVAVGLAAWYLKPAPSPSPARVVRFTYEIPESQQFNQDRASQDAIPLAVSPDGSQFVYGTTEGLYIRSMDALEARPIAGSDKRALQPVFSPDGRWIAYFSPNDRKLKKIPINGGAPVTLSGSSSLLVYGISWDSESTIVYSDLASGIMRISADGGGPESLVKGRIANIKEGLPIYPHILPDGKTLLFTNVFGFYLSEYQIVMIQRIGSNERKVLFKGGLAVGYVPTGHIVYLNTDNAATLYARPFDLEKLETTGGPISLLEGVGAYPSFNLRTLVYAPSPQSGPVGSERALVWVDRHGKETPIAASPKDYLNPRISPDGTKMAVAVNAGGKSDIWIWDFNRENMTRLTLNQSSGFPLWTLDGKRVAFARGLGGEICWKSADGAGEEEKLGSAPGLSGTPSSWARDGKTLIAGIYDIGDAGEKLDIGMITPESKGKWEPLLKESYIESWAEISPDGRWMAYQSDESGKPEVYVRPFPDVNKGKSLISAAGGDFPLWSPYTRELFYRNGDAVMAVKVETDPDFKAGKPEVLFQGKYVQLRNRSTWAIGRDGRFLMMKAVESAGKAPLAESPRKINVVLNWLEELKERVKAK
jgi:Tol biopolymer transport system component